MNNYSVITCLRVVDIPYGPIAICQNPSWCSMTSSIDPLQSGQRSEFAPKMRVGDLEVGFQTSAGSRPWCKSGVVQLKPNALEHARVPSLRCSPTGEIEELRAPRWQGNGWRHRAACAQGPIRSPRRDMECFKWGFDYNFTNYNFKQQTLIKQPNFNFTPLATFPCFNNTISRVL